MTRPDRPLISVVFSFRNEADNIPTLIARLDTMFAGQNADLGLSVIGAKFDSIAFVVPEPPSLKATSAVMACPTWYLNIRTVLLESGP